MKKSFSTESTSYESSKFCAGLNDFLFSKRNSGFQISVTFWYALRPFLHHQNVSMKLIAIIFPKIILPPPIIGD